MSLFKPAWQGDNERKALGAVAKETDQGKLTEIAKTAKIIAVRIAAVEKLTDMPTLADIAKSDDYTSVTQSAEERQKMLVEEISDQSILKGIVMSNNEWYVRVAAVKKIEDKSILADIAQNCDNLDCRRIAGNKLKFASKSMVFRVMTMSVPIHEAQGQLWNYFTETQKNNYAFQNTKASFSGVEQESILLSSKDLLGEPVRWLAAATETDVDTINTLSGIRLFMIKGTFDYKFDQIPYSACYYFSEFD